MIDDRALPLVVLNNVELNGIWHTVLARPTLKLTIHIFISAYACPLTINSITAHGVQETDCMCRKLTVESWIDKIKEHGMIGRPPLIDYLFRTKAVLLLSLRPSKYSSPCNTGSSAFGPRFLQPKRVDRRPEMGRITVLYNDTLGRRISILDRSAIGIC